MRRRRMGTLPEGDPGRGGRRRRQGQGERPPRQFHGEQRLLPADASSSTPATIVIVKGPMGDAAIKLSNSDLAALEQHLGHSVLEADRQTLRAAAQELGLQRLPLTDADRDIIRQANRAAKGQAADGGDDLDDDDLVN